MKHLPVLCKSIFGKLPRGGLLKSQKERLALNLLKRRLAESVRIKESSLALNLFLEN